MPPAALSMFNKMRAPSQALEKKRDSSMDELRNLVMRFPRIEDREADIELGLLMMNGVWLKRRVVITKAVVIFAKTKEEARSLGEEEETVLDAIPMHQVLSIRVLQDDGLSDRIRGTNKPRASHENVLEGLQGLHEAGSDSPASEAHDAKKEGNLVLADSLRTPNIKAIHRFSDEEAHAARSLDETPNTRQDSKKHGRKRRGSTEVTFRNAVEITTSADGYNSGRIYYLQADSELQCFSFMEHIKEFSKAARKTHLSTSRMRRIQEKVRRWYVSTPVQSAVGILILANFGCSIVEAQLNGSLTDPDGGPSASAQTIDLLNRFFIAIFTIELGVNLFSHWLQPFLHDAWCLFDLVIVTASLLSLGPIPIPSAILRLLRAFRVVRLFGRIRAVKQIITALVKSLFPVMNAFLLMFVALSVYAIVGVNFFSDDDPDDFGRFDLSFVTLFRILSGDTWPPFLDVAGKDGGVLVSNVIYVLTFRLFVDWILLQVSVAVLLDNFVSATAQLEAEEKQQLFEEHKRGGRVQNPLDPFLERLTTDFSDDADLTIRLRHYFQEMDFDASEYICFHELCQGLRRLDFDQPIHLTQSDFAALTQNGLLCNERGELSFEQFEVAIRQQMKLFTQRRMADVLKLNRSSEEDATQLSALKSVVLTQQRMERAGDNVQRTLADVADTLREIRAEQLHARTPHPSSCLAEGSKCGVGCGGGSENNIGWPEASNGNPPTKKPVVGIGLHGDSETGTAGNVTPRSRRDALAKLSVYLSEHKAGLGTPFPQSPPAATKATDPTRAKPSSPPLKETTATPSGPEDMVRPDLPLFQICEIAQPPTAVTGNQQGLGSAPPGGNTVAGTVVPRWTAASGGGAAAGCAAAALRETLADSTSGEGGNVSAGLGGGGAGGPLASRPSEGGLVSARWRGQSRTPEPVQARYLQLVARATPQTTTPRRDAAGSAAPTLTGFLEGLARLGAGWADPRPVVSDWANIDTAQRRESASRRMMEPVASLSVRLPGSSPLSSTATLSNLPPQGRD